MPEKNDVFATLYPLDMSNYVAEKNTGKTVLKYISWSDAWAAVRQRFPDATYTIFKDEYGRPYVYDEQSGIMVYTSVTIQGETHDMWMPVMDGANNAMKFKSYEVSTKFGTKQIAAATMFDVNKALMRCLVKNLGMFGLGLYIYSGEDVPEDTEEVKAAKAKELADLTATVDKEVARLTKGMDNTAKVKFAKEVIVPVIGQMNYKNCTNLEQMRTLAENLRAMKDKKETKE